MTFSQKMKDVFDKGLEASRELLNKAGTQAHTWGEQGMLKIEILQMRSQARTLTSKLGAEVYENFIDRGLDSVSRNMAEIAPLVTRIRDLELEIEKKEEAFRTAGGKDDDLGDPDKTD
jgi:hypothetical protein